jgi:excisionase family DNA binding protein
MVTEPWVDSKRASQHLGSNVDWLIANIQKLQIPHTRLGRQYRFRLSEIDQWVSQYMNFEGGEMSV